MASIKICRLLILWKLPNQLNIAIRPNKLHILRCNKRNFFSLHVLFSAYGSILTYVYTLYFEIHWRIRQSFPGLDRVEFPFSPYPSFTDISGGLRIIPHLKEEMKANSIPPPSTHYCIKYQQWGKPHNSLLGIIITIISRKEATTEIGRSIHH